MFGPATILGALLGSATLASARMCPAPSMSRRQTQDPAFTIDSVELLNRLNCTNVGGLAAVRNPYLLGALSDNQLVAPEYGDSTQADGADA